MRSGGTMVKKVDTIQGEPHAVKITTVGVVKFCEIWHVGGVGTIEVIVSRYVKAHLMKPFG